MSTGSLSDIFEELKNIDGAYQPGDPIGDQTTSRSKTFLIDAPEWFDSGSVPRGIPIYFPEEQEAFPFQGEGEAIERLAWYRSYHYGLDNWGVYLLRSGVYKVANALLSAGIEPSLALSRARDFLIRHERTHFQTDFGVTSLELATRQSIFIPTRKQLYSTAPGWHKMEEGLANSYGYRSLKKDKKFIDTFLSTSPTGYRDWRRYKGVTDLETWQTILSDFLVANNGQYLFAAHISNEVSLKYFNEVPIYEVYDIAGGNSNSSYFMGPISKIVETPEFEKDLRKLCKGQPVYAKKWNGVKNKLIDGNLVGVHFEAISKGKSLYSVRIDDEARAGLKHESEWHAIAAGHHDELYRRLNRI
jgi:hypothetical protein